MKSEDTSYFMKINSIRFKLENSDRHYDYWRLNEDVPIRLSIVTIRNDFHRTKMAHITRFEPYDIFNTKLFDKLCKILNVTKIITLDELTIALKNEIRLNKLKAIV